MSNTETNTDLIDSLTAKRDEAAEALKEASARFRKGAKGPMSDILEDDLEIAFEALTVAGQNLREARDGYRFTHPRGACGAKHVHSEACDHVIRS